jgi:signal transduction histidine kinase
MLKLLKFFITFKLPILISTVFIFFSCNQIFEPFIQRGTIKISNPKIIYKLSGLWKFTDRDSPENTDFLDKDWSEINVPGHWITKGYSNRNIGWYKLYFTISENFKNKDLAIIIKNAINSHEIYINGIKIGGVGEIISENEIIKNARPVVHYIPNTLIKSNSLNVISIRLADDVGGGGLAMAPLLCEREICEKEFQLQTMILGGIIFFFLFIGLYNILIFFANKNDYSYLYFGISVVAFSFVTLGNERYTYSLSENFKVHFYIFHPSVYLCSIFVLLTINSFFESKLSIFSSILIIIFSILFSISIFAGVIPEFRKIYYSLIYFYQISILNSLLGIEMIRIIYHARKQNKAGNIYIFLGAISLILSIFLLTLYLLGFINKIFMNEGFTVMICSFTIAFAVRYKSIRDKLYQIEQRNSVELETKVIEKTKELIEINQKLSDSNNIKDKLFSIISHDLKTPLYALKETLNLFNNKQMSKTSLLKYIQIVNMTIETNKFLLENLLHWSLSHMKDSELVIEIIDPRPLIMEVYALHESFAVSKKVQIKINPMAKVSCKGDRNALRLILRNLLSNAIKFTPRNGIIIIDIENSENRCNIIIQDSGIGMNSDTIKYLFQYQRDKISIGTNQEGGSGLGLYICKEFLEKMNGSILVESQPGKGSRFIVELVKSN